MNLMQNYYNMKKSLLIILPLIVLLAVGCGKTETTSADLIATGDISKMHEKKKELSMQQGEIEREIAVLDSAILANQGVKNLPLITALNIQKQSFNHYIELQGDVMTKQNVLIYPEAAGLLVSVKVDEGEKVTKGQLLAVIDDGGISSQLLQMETQLELSKTTFERQERLWNQNIGSEIQYLQAKANYEVQKNAVNQMKSQLQKFRITAPFAGIVDNVFKEQGTVVAPGGPGSEVFRIINLSDMYLEVPVPETYIGTITAGKDVKVFFPVLNKEINSKVRQTSNFINPNNRSFTAEIAVPNTNGAIKPNMTGKVHINDYQSAEAIMIPQSIISENSDGDQYVFLASAIEDDVAIAKRAIITTGKTQGDLVEVMSGLKDNDNIIQEGARSVRDGQEVKILRQ